MASDCRLLNKMACKICHAMHSPRTLASLAPSVRSCRLVLRPTFLVSYPTHSLLSPWQVYYRDPNPTLRK